MDLSFRKFSGHTDVTDKGAFSDKETLKFVSEIPRKEGTRALFLEVNTDEYYEDYKSFSFPFTWVGTEENHDIYECSIKLSDFGKGLYFINLRLSNGRENLLYDKFDYRRQMLIYDGEAEKLSPKNGIIYHIFVDRFCRSGKSPVKENSILNPDWDEGTPQFAPHPGDDLKNNMVFGGDLYGIAEKMEYISSLGVSYIYLSPIFEAYSNHKYDTGNYMKVDESFGGEEALKCLIKKADEYGIKLILDGVFNHTGDDSLYFNKYGNYPCNGAYNSKKSPYYKWYNFEKFPEKYESWWGIKTLPRVDSKNDSYIDYICGENSVVTKWMDLGLGGWRLDVADELSDKFLESFRKRVKSEDKNAVIIGEVWENGTNKISYSERRKYFQGDQLDSVMNYPIREAVIKLFRDKDVRDFAEKIKVLNFQYPDFIKNRLMNLLSTHDTERFITLVAGKNLDNNDNELLSKTFLTEAEFKKGAERLKNAYALLYFLPGQPSLFYGDEIGMEGYHDPFCRRPFKWKKTEDSRILEFFRKLGQVRLQNSVFSDGNLNILHESRSSFVLSRENDSEKIIFALNFSKKPLEISCGGTMINLFNNKKVKGLILKENNIFLGRIPKNKEITVK